MGQSSSAEGPVAHDLPTQRLDSRTLDGVARYIREGKARKIVVMVGAGISTSAGIPDFRSPGTGIYENLARLDLPHPEAVFELSYFRQNPLPFYTLAGELFPGKFKPTISHSFLQLLSQKHLLLKVFTQNIDCLEREAGVPPELLVEAHGSFATQRCIECKAECPQTLMQHAIAKREILHCREHGCEGLVKPDIVFFGEQLPSDFTAHRSLPLKADLCIVMGTSLTVYPFAALPQLCAGAMPRLLINQETAGCIGSRSDDVVFLGDCDDGVRKLANACGWLDELEELWAQTVGAETVAARGQHPPQKSKDELVEEEVEKMTREVEATLKFAQSQRNWLEKHMDAKVARIRTGQTAEMDATAGAEKEIAELKTEGKPEQDAVDAGNKTVHPEEQTSSCAPKQPGYAATEGPMSK